MASKETTANISYNQHYSKWTYSFQDSTGRHRFGALPGMSDTSPQTVLEEFKTLLTVDDLHHLEEIVILMPPCPEGCIAPHTLKIGPTAFR
ncbi:MAG: hypothetical protein EPN91_02285 [Salinibacterium sp.]|nr:MAG: hypothetical protein EPN91_02285 [Salinibacterium sp.]